jgi:membrane protease YdiL (CAAX protease family)
MVSDPELATVPTDVEPPRPTSRNKRVLALMVVMLIAFGWPMVNSTLHFLNNRLANAESARPPGSTDRYYMIAVVFYLVVLGLLAWVLRRQRRPWRELGWAVNWKDVPIAIVLTIVSYLGLYFTAILMFYGYYFATHRPLDIAAKNIGALGISFSAVMIGFAIVNAFYEELLARAYLMTEVTFVTGSRTVAVFVSAGFQAAYHLYQGLPSALMIFAVFLTYSIFFARWKRIFPIILAHMLMDLVAIAYYASQ